MLLAGCGGVPCTLLADLYNQLCVQCISADYEFGLHAGHGSGFEHEQWCGDGLQSQLDPPSPPAPPVNTPKSQSALAPTHFLLQQ